VITYALLNPSCEGLWNVKQLWFGGTSASFEARSTPRSYPADTGQPLSLRRSTMMLSSIAKHNCQIHWIEEILTTVH
jgi:hypothetical protein